MEVVYSSIVCWNGIKDLLTGLRSPKAQRCDNVERPVNHRPLTAIPFVF